MLDVFKGEGAKLLIDAIIATNNEEDCKKLLGDMMTTREILTMAQRMEVVKLLREGKSYVEIGEKTGASTATISRVNRYYTYGNDGYKKVFEKIDK